MIHVFGVTIRIRRSISIGSPYDVDARYASKHQTHWVSDKIYLMETYGEQLPNLMTNGETTYAAITDAHKPNMKLYSQAGSGDKQRTIKLLRPQSVPC